MGWDGMVVGVEPCFSRREGRREEGEVVREGVVVVVVVVVLVRRRGGGESEWVSEWLFVPVWFVECRTSYLILSTVD